MFYVHDNCEFLIFKFSKVMQQHTYGVVGNLILVLLEIYCSLQQWKNFADQSRIDKVIAMVKVAHFFDSRYRKPKNGCQNLPWHRPWVAVYRQYFVGQLLKPPP